MSQIVVSFCMCSEAGLHHSDKMTACLDDADDAHTLQRYRGQTGHEQFYLFDNDKLIPKYNFHYFYNQYCSTII